MKAADRNNPYADYHAADLYAWVSKHGVTRPLNPAFEYSNAGYGLLGEALANRAGTAFPELLRRQVTGPLGLHDTEVTLSPSQRSRFAQARNLSYHCVPQKISSF